MSVHLATIKKIALVSAGSFVFAFAMVPLYEIACEKVFGIQLSETAAGQAEVANMVVDPNRTVRVEFDATVNSRLPWSFQPERLSMEVVPGRPYEVSYLAGNLSMLPVVGTAAPSVVPVYASGYFVKTECFCFTEQLLASGEQKRMPVRFIVDPALPADVHTVTLSYTFFKNEAATARALSAPQPTVAPVLAGTVPILSAR